MFKVDFESMPWMGDRPGFVLAGGLTIDFNGTVRRTRSLKIVAVLR